MFHNENKKQLTKEEKKLKRRKIRKIRLITDSIFTLFWLLWIFLPRLTEQTTIENFEKYVVAPEQMQMENFSIVGLGEGSHGTKQFHEMKLSVFKTLVNQGYKAFCLEGTYGNCAKINEYVQGSDMSLEEAIALLPFRCYRTEQMGEILSYMRNYNKTASAEDKLVFYGFDIQLYNESSNHILQFLTDKNCTEVEGFRDWLLAFDRPDYYYNDVIVERDYVLGRLDQLKALILENGDESDPEWRRALMDYTTIFYGIHLNSTSEAYTRDRDNYMFMCVQWIVEEEARRGNTKIMLSAHNGHIGKAKISTYKTLGMYLDEEYKDQYYALGTDFFKGNVNQPGSSESGRVVNFYYSANPLAANMKNSTLEQGFIDFNSIPENEKLYKIVHKKMHQGSYGEAYSPLMYVAPNTYRLNRIPTELYDGMIVIYEGDATEL